MQSGGKGKDVLSLWHRQSESSESGPTAIRYYLIVERRTGQDAAIRVFDCKRDCFLVDWQGAKVRYLLKSGVLPVDSRRSGCYVCDKSFVWHLILVLAAVQLSIEHLDQVGTGSNNIPVHSQYAGLYPEPVPTAIHGITPAPAGSLSDRLHRLRQYLSIGHHLRS